MTLLGEGLWGLVSPHGTHDRGVGQVDAVAHCHEGVGKPVPVGGGLDDEPRNDLLVEQRLSNILRRQNIIWRNTSTRLSARRITQ